MSLIEPGTAAVDAEGPKIQIVSNDFDDETCLTFCIRDEDHTLLNPLRYIIQKNRSVTFCGYSIPHPSEARANIRIQTDGSENAVDVFHKALDQLMELLEHVSITFKTRLEEKQYVNERSTEKS